MPVSKTLSASELIPGKYYTSDEQAKDNGYFFEGEYEEIAA